MIYILTPTRNRKELTKKFLTSVFNQTYKDYKVVLVDDGSTDGTREMVKESFPKVTVLEGDGNLWWTGAMRVGVEHILPISKEGDYILVQNDDTYMEKDFLKELLSLSEKNDRMIVGTTVKDYVSKKTVYNSHRLVKGSFRPVIVDYNEELVAEVREKDLIDTDTISGRGVLVPIEVFKKVGNFSKLLPHYAADYDFHCRAKKSGFKLGVSRSVTTYSTNPSPNLSKRIKGGGRITIKDFINLYFSRRSSNSLYPSLLITLIHVPFPLNLYGVSRILLVMIKTAIIDIPISSIKNMRNEK